MYRRWFIYFFLYNLIFFCLQLGFIFSEASSFINAIPLPVIVYIGLITTILIHLSLYLLLALLQTALIWGLTKHHLTLISLERWHISIWSLSICALLTSNGYFFPLSRFSRLFLPELPHVFLILFMLVSFLILGILLLNALFFVTRQSPWKMGGSLFVFFTLCFLWNINPINKHHVEAKLLPTAPNIIIIGVDSLSPSNITPQNTPTLARFIKNSVLFKETVSPLARTYPAWTTILTGLYPQHHHARYNLMPPDLVKSSHSIATYLQSVGYQTIFATDDRQFNNMGKEFGFQKIVGPKLGANDILLSNFNDFPLSNLIVNSPISRWLFPYNYINRASHFTYYPQSFDKALQHTLATGTPTPPFFIAVHFTLSHWPYAWAESFPAHVKDEYSLEERGQLYLTALHRVDQQVASLLHELLQYGYLDNSLVMLLSDHGEAFYIPGSRQTSLSSYQGHGTSTFVKYLKRKTSTALEMSVGHGTDLLSADQYHCMLAFKIYKHKQLTTTPKIINTRVGLIDIAPTIDTFIGRPARQHVDGIPLLKAIISNNQPLPERAFIMESGMLPNQFLTREKARLLGQQFFTIDPQNGQLHLRKNELSTLDALKLYAIIEGNWVLALYPDDKGYIPIIMNLESEKWTDELTTDFARTSPAMNMLEQLHLFYKKNWDLVETRSYSNVADLTH